MEAGNDMDKISMIILNYNDSYTTLSLVDEVKDYECLDSVVVVDNHSSDDSWKRLQTLNGSGKVHALRLEQNGGYGMGNQEGINYAVSCLEADYVIIANPDIHVTPRCIRRVKDALDKTQGAVATSARVKDPMGGELFSYWTLLPLWKDLLDTGLVTRRLFKAMLNTPSYRLAYAGDEDCRLVDAVPGSFFMLKTGILTPGEIKEVFDKHIFLYYEERCWDRSSGKWGLRPCWLRMSPMSMPILSALTKALNGSWISRGCFTGASCTTIRNIWEPAPQAWQRQGLYWDSSWQRCGF